MEPLSSPAAVSALAPAPPAPPPAPKPKRVIDLDVVVPAAVFFASVAALLGAFVWRLLW